MHRVLTLGTFDGLHTGHRHMFSEALGPAKGRVLTVGVNSDRFVTEYKGRAPVQSEMQRLAKVAADPHVTEAVLNDGPGRDLILEMRPDMLVVGSDWVDRDYLAQIDVTREELEEMRCSLFFVARLPGFSSTALRSKTFSAVVVTHANPAGAARMLEQLASQSRPPDETILVATETPPGVLEQLAYQFGAVVVAIDEVGDWGHAKRAHGLGLVSGDWVAFFNDDDAYTDDYVEKMLVAATEDVDVVFCEWNENPGCRFAIFQSTAGNFIVRRELAQTVGWTGRDYEADGHFIEAIKEAAASVVKVDEPLYWHNEIEVPA